MLQTIADTSITTIGEVHNITKAIFDQMVEERKVVIREPFKYDCTLVVMAVTYREHESCIALAKKLIEIGLQYPDLQVVDAKRINSHSGRPGILKLS